MNKKLNQQRNKASFVHPDNGEGKYVVLNGVEYSLPEEVWSFLIWLDDEREFYKNKYLHKAEVLN